MRDTTITQFFVVGTPIGNMGDMSVRAIEVLGSVDLILCEDTRVTRKLLSHYGISRPTESYHARSLSAKTERIISMLEDGKRLALVSDAGTPGISDPGAYLIERIRERFGSKIEIVAVPGPSSVTAALSISGFSSSEFLFLGFLPRKKGRATAIREVVAAERTVVFFESPERIVRTLEALRDAGLTRDISIGRELTKFYEEMICGKATVILEHLKLVPEKVRGEFTVLVSGRKERNHVEDEGKNEHVHV